MGKYNKIFLKEAIELISGRDLKKSQCNDHIEGVPYIMGASNIHDGKFIVERWTDSPTVIGKKGDVILTVKGTVGKHFILNENEAHLSRQVMALRVKNGYLNDYIKYFLSFYIERLKEKAKGMIPGITREDILFAEIPDFSLEMQEKIINILKISESIIKKRRYQIEELDQFAISVFFNMFGDPVSNKNVFPKLTIKEIAKRDKNAIKSGPFGSALKKEFYVDKGYKIYGQEQVIRDDFEYGNYYINEEKYKELEKYKISSGDILISLVGTFGKISIVPECFEPGIINPRLMKVSLDTDVVLPEFLKSLLTIPSVIAQIKRLSHGGTMGIINTKIMKDFSVIVPPLKMQEKYINNLKIISEKKSLIEESLTQMELNYHSILQRAYRNQLFTNPVLNL